MISAAEREECLLFREGEFFLFQEKKRLGNWAKAEWPSPTPPVALRFPRKQRDLCMTEGEELGAHRKSRWGERWRDRKG